MALEAQDGWVERVLNVRFGTAEGGGPGQSLVGFAKARLAWQAAKARVAAALDKLRHAIDENADPQQGKLIVQGLAALDRVLGRFNEGLGDTLDELTNETNPQRAAAARARAAEIIDRYGAYLSADLVIAAVEKNPDGPIGIAAILQPPLADIRTQLAAR
jgi:hypothetical protein